MQLCCQDQPEVQRNYHVKNKRNARHGMVRAISHTYKASKASSSLMESKFTGLVTDKDNSLLSEIVEW